jgi:hypothetical protein
MYLESIFKAADIQRQLPNEYKQFDQVKTSPNPHHDTNPKPTSPPH